MAEWTKVEHVDYEIDFLCPCGNRVYMDQWGPSRECTECGRKFEVTTLVVKMLDEPREG